MNKPAIVLEHVSKAFGSQKVLEDVCLQVEHGEALGLLGRSGTGKSVTLKLIIRLLDADAGTIRIDEDEVQQADRDNLMKIRTKIGFLFQNAALFDSISVFENLAFPIRRHGEKSDEKIAEIVRAKLAEVGLEKDGDKMPGDLSGGMKKRAGLARALVLEPSILLIDEPSSGLDRITANEIYELLGKLRAQKRTLVIVTHDAQGVRKFADKLCLLDQGKIIACGKPEELEHDSNELVRLLAGGGSL